MGGNGVSGDCSYDYDGMTPSVGLSGYNMLPTNDQDAVMQHLAEVGPLAVSVYASGWGSSQCGTDSTPMDGSACVGGPGSDEQHVCGQCGVLFDTSFPLGAHNWSMP